MISAQTFEAKGWPNYCYKFKFIVKYISLRCIFLRPVLTPSYISYKEDVDIILNYYIYKFSLNANSLKLITPQVLWCLLFLSSSLVAHTSQN